MVERVGYSNSARAARSSREDAQRRAEELERRRLEAEQRQLEGAARRRRPPRGGAEDPVPRRRRHAWEGEGEEEHEPAAEFLGLREHLESRLGGVEAHLEQQQAEVGRLGELSARMQSLEVLAERQHDLISGLTSLTARLSQELAALRLDHAALQEGHGSLLRSCGALPADLGGSRRGRALAPMRRVLAEDGAMAALRRLAGDGGVAAARLAAASRSLWGLRARPPASRSAEPSPRPEASRQLDEGAWRRLASHEPTAETLDLWARSATVQTVLSNFWVEAVAGSAGVLTFRDVRALLGQLGLSMERFVSKFTCLPAVGHGWGAEQLESLTREILERFESDGAAGHAAAAGGGGGVGAAADGALKCRDVFRLLELIGYPLQRFKARFKGGAGDDGDAPPQQLQLGDYCIRRLLARGARGVCYEGQLAADEKVRVALKWPAPEAEVSTLRDIHRRASAGQCGLPRFLASGTHGGHPYLVTELLGAPLTRVFQRLGRRPPRQRLAALRVIGRLLLRRIEALHRSGFIHCDISPENVMLGPAPDGSGEGVSVSLYLIDFEHAQRHPGGRELDPACGSAEWSSVRSADGGERRPEDDLEALGWMLLHGHVGALPWFAGLNEAYKDWDSTWIRNQAVKQAQRAKVLLLDSGLQALGASCSAPVPEEIDKFIRACGRRPCAEGSRGPPYLALMALLGGDAGLSGREAEQQEPPTQNSAPGRQRHSHPAGPGCHLAARSRSGSQVAL